MSQLPCDTSKALREAIRSAKPLVLLLALAFSTTLPIACRPDDPIAEIRELHASGSYQESLEPLQQLLESRPDDPEVFYLYGIALTGTSQVTQAVWPLRRAMEHPDWYMRAALQLANLASMTSDWDMAIETLDPLLEREPENTQALLLRAYARAQSRQDYEGALADADAVLEHDATSGQALTIRGVALLGLERIEEAGEAIEAATAHFESAGLGLAESPRFCVVRAIFSKEKNEIEAAEKIFEECLEKYPVHFLVVDEAAKFFNELGRYDRSLEIVRTAFEGAPGARSYRLSLVSRLSMAGEHEEAEQLMLEATQAEQPEVAASAFADLAGYYFEREQLDEAVSAFEQATNLVPDPGPEFLFNYADTLVAAERYEKALALADRMTVVPHRELIRGRVALQRGSPEEALKHFSEGLKLWPANAIARFFAGTAAEQIGEFDRAIEEYRYSIRADAGATDARLRLAQLYLAEGNDSSALEVIRHNIGNKPHGDLKPILLELEILARLGRGHEMPEHVAAVIRPPDVWAQAVTALAKGARARRGPAAAAKIVLKADRLDLTAPLNSPALSSLVVDLIDIGRTGEALARLDAALRAHPEAGEFHALKGLALSRSGGDTDEAHAAWERALKLDPENAVALRGLAGLEAAGGDPETALALYRRATSADPEDTVALRETAEILAAQERHHEAEQELETLLERDAYHGVAALRLAQLLQLHPEASRDEARIIVLLRGAARFGAEAKAEKLLERLAPGGDSKPTPQ